MIIELNSNRQVVLILAILANQAILNLSLDNWFAFAQCIIFNLILFLRLYSTPLLVCKNMNINVIFIHSKFVG